MEVAVSPVLPRRDDVEMVNTSITIPKELREKVEALALERGYSRSEVISKLLSFGLTQLEAEDSLEGADLFEALNRAEQHIQAAKAVYQRGLEREREQQRESGRRPARPSKG